MMQKDPPADERTRHEVTCERGEIKIVTASWRCPHCSSLQKLMGHTQPDALKALFELGESIEGQCGTCQGPFVIAASRLVRMVKGANGRRPG